MVCEYIQRMRQIEYDNITILVCKMISYRQVSNIRRTFVGYKIAYHSTARLGEEQLSLVIWCALY